MNFQGGTFEQQQADPVLQLVGSGQYRDIPANLISSYLNGSASQEATLAAIKGTPIFNPTIGPQVNAGNGPEKIVSMNASGQGFNTATSLKNQADNLQAQATAIKAKAPTIGNPVTAPVSTPQVQGTSTGAASLPSLPEPTAPTAVSTYLSGVTADVANAKSDLQNTYDTKIQDLNNQIAQLRQTSTSATASLNTIENSNTVQNLEQTLQQRYQVQANFDANQASISELETIMNTTNAQILAAQNTTGLKSITDPTVALMQKDAAARVGVIQAVMKARSDQIATAFSIIDKTVAAVQADQKDQIAYYTSIKDAADKGILSLQSDEKTYVDAQVKLQQDTLDSVQKTADFIKSQMTDPKTAQFMEAAGVKLTDTIDQIEAKMAQQAGIQARNDLINTMGEKGYSQLTPAEAKLRGDGNFITMKDSNGSSIYFDKPNTGGTNGSVSTVTGPNGQQVSVPVDVAPYYNTSHSGVGYADLSNIQGTAAQKKAIVDAAQAAGIKVILNKNTAADLSNISDANNKLDSISQIMSNIDQPGPLSRALYSAGLTWLATKAQTNPQQAAADSLHSVGLDMLKAISGVQGFRGNSTVVQQINDHLPSIYDTNAVAQQKLEYIRQLITDRENGLLGTTKNNGIDLSTYENGGTGNSGSTSNGVDLSKFNK